MHEPGLLGRELECRTLEELVASGDVGPKVLVLVGEPGSGRTALVALARAAASGAGRRTLTVAGVPGEESVALAGLSQLLVALGPRIESLSAAHRDALSRPLGLRSDVVPFDLVATGMAVLALVTLGADGPPLLVTVDDADHVDRETVAVLAFVAERVSRRTAVLLLTAEPTGVPAPFERTSARLRIGPLGEADAHRLLERHGPPLDGALRHRIVEQSGGNPLVLLETAATAALPNASPTPDGEPLRLGRVVEERVMARFRRLPRATQTCLNDAAVRQSAPWGGTASSPVSSGGLAALGPAERGGFVHIDHAGVRFTHPAFRIAILDTMPFALWVEAQRRVAATLVDQPSRRAWHLGRAALEPDESIAALLESTADDAGRRLGRHEEARALERAATLSPDPDDRARRLLAAAGIAAPTGDMAWVEELAARARSCARDPRLRVRSITTSAWAAAARGRFGQAMADLSRAAAETVDTAPEAAWEVLSIAAAVGYQSGSRAVQVQMDAATRHLANGRAPETRTAAARSLWIASFLHPGVGTGERLTRLGRLRADGPTDEPSLSRLAGAAWLDDESEAAFDLAEAAYGRLRDQGSHASAAVIGPIRSWTAWDTGQWDAALDHAADTSRVARAAGGGMLEATGDAVAALVHAARGAPALASAHARAALDLIEGEECRSVVARGHQALGLSATASGDYAAAYGHLSRLFREDGTPLHFHISFFGIADLAAAALRADHVGQARTLLGHVLDALPDEPAVRITHLLLRAQALLADSDDDAETHFRRAHGDPAGSRWPFERAQLLLDYGAWLRRRRRVGDAKPLLGQARDTFDALGAVPWRVRAEAELRASHVDVARPVGTLGELTGQQREIVLLAGQGLTNREIAARMYLSPRTVASHLYRSFPKLGIRDRWQLRDLVDPTGEPQADQAGPPPLG